MNRFVFILILFTSSKTFGQLKLTGRVIDLHNSPVELATVKLTGLNRIAMTNDSGYFHMSLPSGIKKDDRITLNVSKDGYKDAVKNATIADALITIILDDNNPAPVLQKSTKVVTINAGDLQNNMAKFRTGDELLKRKLDKESLESLLFFLTNKNESIRIICIAGDNEALSFATQVHDLLTLNGYKKVSAVSVVNFDKPVTGQFLNRDKSGVQITVGHKPANL